MHYKSNTKKIKQTNKMQKIFSTEQINETRRLIQSLEFALIAISDNTNNSITNEYINKIDNELKELNIAIKKFLTH